MRKLFLLLLSLFVLNSGYAQQRNLSFYVAKAQENSPLIFKNQNEMKIIGLDTDIIRAITKPQVTLDARILLAPIISHDSRANKLEVISKEASSYNGYDLAATDGGQYQSVITLRQPLFTKTQTQAYENKADISVKVANNSITLTGHELEKVVTHQYLLCLKSKQQANISQDLLKKLADQIALCKQLVEQAIYKQSDLLLLQIELQNYQLELASYQSEYKDNLYDLNLICGITDTATVDLQEVDIPLKRPLNTPSGFLTSFVLDSLGVQAEQAISDLKYRPTIDLFADGGLNAVYLPTLNRFGMSAGVALSWNLFDGNQQSIQKKKSRLYIQSIENDKKQFLTENRINKDKTLNQIEAIGQKTLIIDRQLIDYRRLMAIYQAQIPQGDVSVMEYKNVFKDIASKEQENISLKMEKQALIIFYNYLNY